MILLFRWVRWALLPLGFLAFVSCAGPAITSSTDPEKLMELACRPGSETQSLKGSLWMKATSKEGSGQFPAVVEAHAPGSVHLEVTNLLGATQAVIDVHNGHYEVRALNKSGELKPAASGRGSWGGIPLHWAGELFLGRIPCPSSSEEKGAKLSISPDQNLIVRTAKDQFTYHFRSWEGQPWPESLLWEQLDGRKARVDFKFDDPEDKTRSPKKWEAHSTDGEVKVRWKDREIAR